MAVQKPTAPTTAEIDIYRQDAARHRALTQEWTGTAMQDIIQSIARLHSEPGSSDLDTQAAQVFSLCDQISVAAEVAAASVHVAGNERFELASEMADIGAAAAREESAVKDLRNTLLKERVRAKRKEAYEALAGLVSAEPSPEVSKAELEKAKAELRDVEKEAKRMEKMRDAMSKEFSLFLHCSTNLDGLAKQVAGMVERGGKEEEEGEETEEGEDDERAAMDTSA